LMFARNPLRRDQRDGAGLDGQIDLGVIELARSFAQVGEDPDRLLFCADDSGGEKSKECGAKNAGTLFLQCFLLKTSGYRTGSAPVVHAKKNGQGDCMNRSAWFAPVGSRREQPR